MKTNAIIRFDSIIRIRFDYSLRLLLCTMKTNAKSSRIRKIQSTCSSMLLTKTTLCEVQGVCTKLIKLESKNNIFNNVRCMLSSKLGFLIHNNVMAKAKGKIKTPQVKVLKSHVKKTNTTKAVKSQRLLLRQFSAEMTPPWIPFD